MINIFKTIFYIMNITRSTLLSNIKVRILLLACYNIYFLNKNENYYHTLNVKAYYSKKIIRDST